MVPYKIVCVSFTAIVVFHLITVCGSERTDSWVLLGQTVGVFLFTSFYVHFQFALHQLFILMNQLLIFA